MNTTTFLPKPQGTARPIVEPRPDLHLEPDLLEDWQELLETLAGMLAADTVCIRRLHHATVETLLSAPAESGTPRPGERLRPEADTPFYCQPVIDTGQPLAIEDTRTDPRWKHGAGAVAGAAAGGAASAAAGIGAYYGQPLRLSDGTLFGVLELYFESPRQVPAVQRRYIQQVAAAINARLFCLTGCQRLRKASEERRQAAEGLQRSEEELRVVNATQEKLIGIIAHDVYGSVAALSDGLRELAARGATGRPEPGEPSDADRAVALPALAEEAANTRALLEELMLWSRCQRGGLECRCQMIEISFAVDECLGLLVPMAKRKSIKLDADIPRGVHILADADMLQTSLRQVITNAIKFTQAGGRVFVEAERHEGDVTLTVRDNGRGIDPQVRARLFQSGPGTSTAGTRNERGTGFGLAICKDLTEQSGGEMWLESEDGLGTKVCLRFPAGT